MPERQKKKKEGQRKRGRKIEMERESESERDEYESTHGKVRTVYFKQKINRLSLSVDTGVSINIIVLIF